MIGQLFSKVITSRPVPPQIGRIVMETAVRTLTTVIVGMGVKEGVDAAKRRIANRHRGERKEVRR